MFALRHISTRRHRCCNDATFILFALALQQTNTHFLGVQQRTKPNSVYLLAGLCLLLLWLWLWLTSCVMKALTLARDLAQMNAALPLPPDAC